MEFKGTKGKWELQNKTPYTKVIYCYKSNAEIARVFEEGFINKSQMEANALLISKAPEMLEMLKNMYSKYQEKGHLLDVSPSAIERLIKEATEI
jgi:hypothetical protein